MEEEQNKKPTGDFFLNHIEIMGLTEEETQKLQEKIKEKFSSVMG